MLHEAAELSGPMAAEEAGVAHATVAISLRRTAATLVRSAVEGAAQLAEGIGLPADLDGARVLDVPYLSLVPPALEVPAPADRVVPLAYRLTDVHSVDGPAVDLDDATGPLVWVSLGTEAWHLPGLMERVLPILAATAVARPTVRFLLTVGASGVDVPPLPDNVRVVGYVPQEQVLAACTTVLGHGGFNTTLAALSAGRPQVVVPLFSTDQFETAARIDEVGAGVAVTDPTPEGLTAALDRVLTDDVVAATTASIAEQMARLPRPDEVLATLVPARA